MPCCPIPPVAPYKALENFSKALYGTTGGTYSARVFRPVMHDVLKLMRNAKWMKRRNLTPADEIQQSLTEVEIRKKRGTAIILHRSDLRCGGKPFFLHSPDFDYPLPPSVT